MTPMFSIARQLRALWLADQRREGVPGEHWAVFGAALGTINAARRVRSPLLRAAVLGAGGVLLLRALSGRDGAIAVLISRSRPRRAGPAASSLPPPSP